MDPNVLVQLALMALQAVLNIINGIKAQHGLTDDQILAQAQQVTAGNDALYATLVAALTAAPTTVPAPTNPNNPPLVPPPVTPPIGG